MNAAQIWDGEVVAQAARSWLGTPYRHHASTREAGCDCLGLLRGVWRDLNGAEPAVTPAYRADWRDPTHAGALVAAAEAYLHPVMRKPACGDIVLVRLHRSMPPKHCIIMSAPERFVHAQEELGVVEANLSESWRRIVAGVYCLPKLRTS